MRWLGEAARLGCGNVGWLAIGPEFEPLLALPGFDAVRRQPVGNARKATADRCGTSRSDAREPRRGNGVTAAPHGLGPPPVGLAESMSHRGPRFVAGRSQEPSMRHPAAPRLPLALLSFAALIAALSAQGAPIGFEERWALADDRAALVATLIQGSPEWHYWRCRERLDARDFATVRRLLAEWQARHGESTQWREIRDRELLLSHASDPQRTFQQLRARMGYTYGQRPDDETRQEPLPTRLDPALLSPTTLAQRARERHPDSVNGFADLALPGLATAELTDAQLTSLLGRLQRADVDNLPQLVVRQSRTRFASPFGSLTVHKQMSLPQLEECARLLPDLLRQPKFVEAWLDCLAPSSDQSLDDPTTRAAHLAGLWEFAQRLPAQFNSLKAHVLHWQLRLDLAQGTLDKERFLAYLRLPRRSGPVARTRLEAFPRADEHVDLRRAFDTGFAAVGDDTGLLRACLERLFAAEDAFEPYAEWLDGAWTKAVLAETKLMLGQGDPQRWYGLLDDPTRLEALRQRVEIRFAAEQKTRFAANDTVSLLVDVKNVKKLVVKVFAVDAFRYHVEKQKEVDATIELDGVVPSFEQAQDLTEPEIRRVRRTFDLPMLTEPGTYVVEFVGGGISSRAVVHKGSLRAVGRLTAAGHAFAVFDEAGVRVRDAVGWYGGRELAADARGEIHLPFTSEEAPRKLVLAHGNRSAIAPFVHRAESFDLSAGAHIEREELVAGRTAKLVLRPCLRIAGREVSLGLLEGGATLALSATDLDGRATLQEVRLPELRDGRELTHELAVPERLQRLAVSLRGKVKAQDGKLVDVATGTTDFVVNGIDQGAGTAAPMLLATPDGFALELRGKDGEPKAGRTVDLELRLRDFVDPVQVALQTDAAGRIALGGLPGVLQLTARTAGYQGRFDLPQARATWPDVLHGRAGETLRLPWRSDATTPSRIELSLHDNRIDRFGNLAVVDGFLELRGLPADDFTLVDHVSGQRVRVRVTDGAASDGWLANRERILEATDPAPLQLQPLAIEGDELVVRVANATPDTRVHVAAARHLPDRALFTALHAPMPPEAAVEYAASSDSQFESGRELGDELRYVMERRFQQKHPGNMLARPGLLLNPWATQDTTNAAVGISGGAGRGYGGRGGAARKAASMSPGPAGEARPGETAPADHANLDWLAGSGALQANLAPDRDGVVRVKLAALGSGGFVTALAIDGPQRAQRQLVRAEAPATVRSRALAKALDAATPKVEQKRIEFLPAGKAVELADPRGAEVAIHDTLGDGYRLLQSVARNDEFAKFAFLGDWAAKSADEKATLYREHACHELHFFLFRKDRAFFDAVIKPFLQQKLEKDFLDRWLLDEDLTGYLQPWAFARLCLVERVLLAQRLDASGRARIARTVRDALQLRPADVTRLGELFAQALVLDAMDGDAGRQADKMLAQLNKELGEVAEARNVVRRFGEQQEAGAPPAAGGAPAPAGPTTGGAGGPEDRGPGKPGGGAKGGELKDDAGRPGAGDEKAKADNAFDSNQWNSAAGLGYGSSQLAAERAQRARGDAPALFRAVASTQRLVESNWWRMQAGQVGADAVAPNRFWAEFAEAKPGLPFVSTALAEASGTCMEMLMALGAIDLPFTAGKHEYAPGRFTAGSPLLLVRKEVVSAEAAAAQAPLLIGQNYYRLDERHRMVNGEQRDAFVTDEFLVDVPYGCQVVVTNPTSTPRTVDLLLQVPQGALPVQQGFWTRGKPTQLGAYATATVDYAFYFPAAGSFPHFPAHASQKDKDGVDRHATAAPAKTLAVVVTPSKVDAASWEHVSQRGTAAEALAWLERENVHAVPLARLAWRMADKEFFAQALAALRTRHAFDETLWSFALLHGDAQATRELLQRVGRNLLEVGMAIDSPLLTIDPIAEDAIEQAEFAPLVHARAHRLGDRRVIGNPAMMARHQQLMAWLGYQPKLGAEHWLRVCQFLALQDRIDDAVAAWQRIDASQLASLLQYDYLTAWLSCCTGETARARELATRHQDHPVAHWRQRFRDVLATLDEADGKVAGPDAGATVDPAAKAPALELSVVDGAVQVAARNVARVELRWYELDVEFAFSAQPFAAAEGTAAAFVRPTLIETRDVPAGQDPLAIALPERFRQRNVLVEARAGGLVRSQHVFANALDARFLESMGQVVVTARGAKTPAPKVYVKVFARLPNGAVRFHKDGYTDLRGRFDYASLSDDPNAGATRYAVLVLDEQRGAVIRDIAPPAK